MALMEEIRWAKKALAMYQFGGPQVGGENVFLSAPSE